VAHVDVFASLDFRCRERPPVTAITPKARFEPLFVLDRRERFAGEMGVVWLPGQVSGELYYITREPASR
jgi:hypothetical protein